jgi:hypothetical protein
VGGCCGGSGAGGAIHLIAPNVTNNGGVTCSIFRVAGTYTQTGNTFCGPTIIGPLFNPGLPNNAVPQIKVTSVNGVNAPSDVQASLLAPDFTLNTTSTVTVNISAQNIPVGTVVKLYLTSAQANDATITCSALAGTLASSTASCTGVAFPQGVTISDIRAVW